MLNIFKRKAWLNDKAYFDLYGQADEINKMLSGLIASLK